MVWDSCKRQKSFCVLLKLSDNSLNIFVEQVEWAGGF